MIKQDDKDEEYQNRLIKYKRSETSLASTKKRIDYAYYPFVSTAWKIIIIKIKLFQRDV